MRKYFGVTSIIIFILTIVISILLGKLKYRGMLDEYVVMIGSVLVISTALFSRKGRFKTILLSIYGILIVGIILTSLLLGSSGL